MKCLRNEACTSRTCAHLGFCDQSKDVMREHGIGEGALAACQEVRGAACPSVDTCDAIGCCRKPDEVANRALREAVAPVEGPFMVDGPVQPPNSKPSNPKDAISDSKLPMFLVSPFVKMYYAIAMFLGGVKYGYWNYRGVGARASVYLSALERHIDAYKEGQWYDPVDGTPHLANALACIGIIIDATHSGKLTDDRAPSNTDEYAKVRAEFEALMPKIRAAYPNHNPKHYTIADK